WPRTRSASLLNPRKLKFLVPRSQFRAPFVGPKKTKQQNIQRRQTPKQREKKNRKTNTRPKTHKPHPCALTHTRHPCLVSPYNPAAHLSVQEKPKTTKQTTQAKTQTEGKKEPGNKHSSEDNAQTMRAVHAAHMSGSPVPPGTLFWKKNPKQQNMQ